MIEKFIESVKNGDLIGAKNVAYQIMDEKKKEIVAEQQKEITRSFILEAEEELDDPDEDDQDDDKDGKGEKDKDDKKED